MDFNRLQALSREIDIMNAIINNVEGVEFNKLFENENDANSLTDEFKLNKLCELAYKVFKSTEVKEENALLNMFDEIYPDNGVGKFCVDFIKINLDMSRENIGEKIKLLTQMDCSLVPDAQIKIDYYNLILTLLLNQEPLDIDLINKYNEELKALMNK